MAYLILARHAKSEWNDLGRWTGWTDVSLSPEGELEAERAAEHLKDIEIHETHTSPLIRTKQTLQIIKKKLGISHLKDIAHDALKERNYGTLTGKNKWDIKKEIGEEQFQKIRRGWNQPIPEGETLEDVYKRVVPYYERDIFGSLKDGKNVLVVAHGNSLRALAKYLENIPDDEISKLEIGVAELHIYKMDEAGKILDKEIRAENKNKGKI